MIGPYLRRAVRTGGTLQPSARCTPLWLLSLQRRETDRERMRTGGAQEMITFIRTSVSWMGVKDSEIYPNITANIMTVDKKYNQIYTALILK